MSNELVINVRPYQTRVALVENGIIVELYIERKTGQDYVGNIYRGRVVRVLPGMQAAFVDIGLDRTAFLYVADVHKDLSDLEKMMLRDGREEGEAEQEPDFGYGSDRQQMQLSIEDLLHEGQDIMVQVAKEPFGTKGARVTGHISLAGRHLVLMPTVNHIGISRRIEDRPERERLKSLMQEIRPSEVGFIVRTVSEDATREKLKSEMDFLIKLYASIQAKMERGSNLGILYRELSISLRAVRDLFTNEVDRLIIDSQDEYNNIMDFIATFAPGLASSVELYAGKEPIFDAFGLEMDISRAMEKKIWLKSGGYIVIESTEALTAIDVNTGSYVGARNLEETILKTNLEAVKEIAYQLRFRNLGGIIVIDFIDMEKIVNREKVFSSLKEALSKDRAKSNVLHMSDLGLIEMTRKRSRANLNSLLTEQCPYCEGRSFVRSKKTVCYEIFVEIEKESAALQQENQLYLTVNPKVEEMLREEEQESVFDLENRTGKRIIIVSNKEFHLEQYDISV
ncbi:MAG: Rne/Rng family ribonuclease [Deltaproteobacteria bacterium CG_4_8_14_3_um_filter_51_11]|nr:Rne/Rng family ribonuclease [bacterium]OIP41689.1 MAG: ribonuclease E/G [Desulfobacteraceae bacterium CG2_30_51_40]PIP45541.1 MAG: Rne/Rng family ribonuclease [Deltaproteobacteria bacterium CG23_combo_of_CG06-09_8_20_14_all_51_20]PIW00253.1 MAG: Rne/Rng family ribonuclease [Deltaproteobacteria bacterium CG17_big_fil_post_rev_8_21_14_2_50_51_6]PIX20095.1 MAG: Rne/Rng family ribonuclease [Deltaproteobacteria bacterium CG_4_8_14_3_um_filter_51_11]PIY22799.1 MAG: Rne/Rng family ribonuclease [De